MGDDDDGRVGSLEDHWEERYSLVGGNNNGSQSLEGPGELRKWAPTILAPLENYMPHPWTTSQCRWLYWGGVTHRQQHQVSISVVPYSL